MNDDAQLIKAALDRRFARATTPPCPEVAWHAASTEPATAARPRGFSHRFTYAAALVGVIAIGGLAAQAASSIKAGDSTFTRWFGVSTRPLMPKIHAADRLTIAEAQRRMPFPIVVPKGLPAGTRLLYAHVVSEKPNPRVSLQYEAHVGSKYYDININELTGAAGPPVAHFKGLLAGHAMKSWNLPLRRWKHGAVIMEMVPKGLPAAMTERIVQANTM
jgi:hypothetical protein